MLRSTALPHLGALVLVLLNTLVDKAGACECPASQPVCSWSSSYWMHVCSQGEWWDTGSSCDGGGCHASYSSNLLRCTELVDGTCLAPCLESVTVTLSPGVQETYEKTTTWTTGCTCLGEYQPVYQQRTSSGAATNKFLRFDCGSERWVTAIESDSYGPIYKPSYFTGSTVATIGTTASQCPYTGSPQCSMNTSPPPSFATKASLEAAVQMWVNDHVAALNTYGPISGWGVSSITNMRELFRDLQTFNEDISSWDTSGVTTMYGMFLVRPLRARRCPSISYRRPSISSRILRARRVHAPP